MPESRRSPGRHRSRPRSANGRSPGGTPADTGGPPSTASAGSQPSGGAAAPQKIHLTPEGMLVEPPTSARSPGGSEEDPRTLAGLAADVMAAVAAEEPAEAPEETAEEPEALGDGPPAGTPSDEPAEPADTRRRGRRRTGVLIALLLLLSLGLSSGSSGSSGPPGAAAALLPAEGDAISGGVSAPSPHDDRSPAVATATPAATPTPGPTTGGEPTSAPAAIPTPTLAPAPTATPVPPAPTSTPVPPAPTPTPTPGPTVHVGDLDGAPIAGHKVEVRVYVHDLSHNPVVGASVVSSGAALTRGLPSLYRVPPQTPASAPSRASN